jgi:hypothetical protein
MVKISADFAAVFGNKADATTMEQRDFLNFALTLEYIEAEFYNLGLSASGLIPAGKDRAIFKLIE